MYDLTSKETIFYLSKKYGFANKKSLGQNFLLDPGVLAEITNAAGDGGILEIGPGIGTLTGALCQKAKRVVSVEVDQSLEPVLTETMAGFSNWKLVFGDVLKVNLPKLLEEEFAGLPVSVAANLPYYITTPILTMLLQSHLPFESIVVMVQKEVANRILAQSGGKDYGALTVFLNYYTEASLVCEVPKESFFPAPKVDSAVVKLALLKKPRVDVAEKDFFPLVRAAFSQRRKTLANAIANSGRYQADKESLKQMLKDLNINENARGETLSIEQFAKLVMKLTKSS